MTCDGLDTLLGDGRSKRSGVSAPQEFRVGKTKQDKYTIRLIVTDADQIAMD